MSEVLNGVFKLEEQFINYEFQVEGPQRRIVNMSLEFNKVPIDPEFVFTAGVYLMHYLAHSVGIEIDPHRVKPRLPKEGLDYQTTETEDGEEEH